jgi:uncharacterized protein
MECTLADLAENQTATRIAERAVALELDPLTAQLDAGELLLKDILAQLARPGRDPREDLPPPIFKKGVIKLDDLTPGMELSGTVLNVVDFGAFVDIGLHDTGLVHISQLANKYVRDPHEVVSVGDIVKVWVHEIDKTRRRVSLTMIPPGSERAPPPKRGEKRKGDGKRGGTPHQAAAAPSAGAPADAALQQAGRPAAASAEPDRRPARPGRQPQRGGPRRQHEQAGAPPKPKFKSRPRSEHKPKPLIPLTNEMKAGKEPLRTFGDLKQFIELKTQAPEEQPESTSEAPSG